MVSERTDIPQPEAPEQRERSTTSAHPQARGMLVGWREWLCVALALAGTALVRVLLALRGWPYVNGDGATLGLMADDILWHGAHPLYSYGGHHIGALDAYFQAPFFALFGATNATMQIVTTIEILAFLVIFYLFMRRIFSAPVAFITLLLLGFGAEQALFFEMRTNRHGQDILFFSALLLWLVYLRLRRPQRRIALFAFDLGIGLVMGVGLWSSLLTLPFALAALLALAVQTIKDYRAHGWRSAGLPVLLLAGLFVGFAPALAVALKTRGGSLQEGLTTASVGDGHSVLAIVQQLGGTFLYGVPSMFGSRAFCSQCVLWPSPNAVPPTAQIIQITVIGLAFSALVIGCWLLAALPLARDAWRTLRRRTPATGAIESLESGDGAERNARWWGRAMLVVGTGLTVLEYAGGRASFTAVDTAPRYLMGVYLAVPFIVAPIYAGVQTLWRWLTTRRASSWRALLFACLGVAALLTLFAVNIQGEAHAFQETADAQQYGVPAGTRDVQLLDFLQAHHATRFYSTWWVCYRLMFDAQEHDYCSVVNDANPLESGVNMVPDYAQAVTAAPHPAYLFDLTTNEAQPDVPQEIAGLIAAGDPRFKGYTSATVGGYIVFYYAGP